MQSPGLWGASGSGALHTTDRLSGSGLLLVRGGRETGTFDFSGNLGGGNFDAAVGLDSQLNYICAVNVNGNPLTINGVEFNGYSGIPNPAGANFATDNFGNRENRVQTVVTGGLGTLVSSFNYGGPAGDQHLYLNNLIAGQSYTLNLYHRVWNDNGNRTQIITTTSGGVITINPDGGDIDTFSWLKYTFVASQSRETLTFRRQSQSSYHLYGFTLSVEPLSGYLELTRRDSGSQSIESDPLADYQVLEGTGAVADLMPASGYTAINSLTYTATDGATTLDLDGKTLALNNLIMSDDSGALAVSGGVLTSPISNLVVETHSTNNLIITAVIDNHDVPLALSKTGAGTLTVASENLYSGATTVDQGTLRVVSGGRIGSGEVNQGLVPVNCSALTVRNSTLDISGGSVYAGGGEKYEGAFVNQSGGTMYHATGFGLRDTLLNLSGGRSYCNGSVSLSLYGNIESIVNITDGHVADWRTLESFGGTVCMNLTDGGTLLCDEIRNGGADSTLLFDGGILGVSSKDAPRAVDDWIKTGTSIVIADEGAIIETDAGHAAINQPFIPDFGSAGGLTKRGVATLTLGAFSTYTGATLVEAGTLKMSAPALLVNAGFEKPIQTGWSYLRDDGLPGGWSISWSADTLHRGGFTCADTPWVAAGAIPEGLQAAFIQREAHMTQSVYIPISGEYRLEFMAANRKSAKPVGLDVHFGGIIKASWSYSEFENGSVFKNYSTSLGYLTPGVYLLDIAGTRPDDLDRATAIDDVRLMRADGRKCAPLPSGVDLNISYGAALELDGTTVAASALSGAGELRNSSATNAVLMIGGSGASSTFAGTIGDNITLIKQGAGTFVLGGSNTSSSAVSVEAGVLQLAPPDVAVMVGNHSFETYDVLERGNWGYEPSGTGWIFSSSDVDPRSGIAKPGSPWVASGAQIDSAHTAYLQSKGGSCGTVTTTLTAPHSGWYVIEFLAGKRPNFSGSPLNIKIDGITMFSIAADEFTDNGALLNGLAVMREGENTLAFSGQDMAGDQATWFDRVAVRSIGGALPDCAEPTLASGSVLDLNGNTQMLESVTGEGTVSNGTLVLTSTIAPGGINTIGTLTMSSSPDLSAGVTLLIDLAQYGECDLLSIGDDLDISTVELSVTDTELLDVGQSYTIVNCDGELNGTFSYSNLPENWYVRYDRNNKTATITFPQGMVIIIR